MEQKASGYEMKEQGEISEFSIYYSGNMIMHKETVKFQVEKDGKFLFTGTCLKACAGAVATMGKHYQKVIKALEEGRELCNEVNVYWRMTDEEVNQLNNFVKSIKNKKYIQIFHYRNRSNPEESEE